MKIDFTTFVITGPSTTTLSNGGFMVHGNIIGYQALNYDGTVPAIGTADNYPSSRTEYALSSNCLADTFTASSSNPANKPPELCGTNTGFHMYVDADTECNTLEFNLAIAVGGAQGVPDSYGVASLATRSWDMTITQYECGHILQAPPGCTQYHHGALSGLVTSYNFAGSKHLANQNQKICIRREQTACYACFAISATDTSNAFDISTENTAAGTNVGVAVACGYNCETGLGMLGPNGQIALAVGATESCGYDCLIIPGAFAVASYQDLTSTGSGVVVVSPPAANIRAFSTIGTAQFPIGPQFAGGTVLGTGLAGNVEAVGSPSTPPWSITKNAPSAIAATICTKTVPFQLTVKTDAFEHAGTSGEFITAAQNQGIELTYTLVTCS